MRIIPAIDIINGKCVRLSQGDYSTSKIYDESPVEVAKKYEDAGIQYLHVVDLDGAKAKKLINIKVLEQICSQTSLTVDFGGGLQSEQDIQLAFNGGAAQVTLGSVAVKHPEFFSEMLEKYGPEKIILGADAKDRKVAVHGWLDQTETDVVDLIADLATKGVEYVVSTDIAKDGMLNGPSLELYQDILDRSAINLIASGGISCLKDIDAVKAIGCEGVIIGKAIYEQKITLKELSVLC